MKTAAVYIRVSTDDQLEYSPDAQLKAAREYARKNDMIISEDHIFMDEGISGKSVKKRQDFNRMIGVAKSKPRPFDVILLWKFSRFARNREDSIVYKSMLRRQLGIEVISITESIGDDKMSVLIEAMIEAMDEYYSINLAEEVKKGMTEKATRGEFQSSPPLGYRKQPGQPLQIVDSEAEYIRYIFDQYLSGVSMFAIASRLNTMGVTTKRGGRMENRTVEYILNNPIYAGYVRWSPAGKTIGNRNFHDPNTLTVKSDHEPIIDQDTFDRAQEKLRLDRIRHTRGERPIDSKKHYLTGILKCGSCGSTLSYAESNNGFQCIRYTKGTCKPSHFVQGGKIEMAILKELDRIGAHGVFLENIRNISDSNDERELLRREISALERMMERAKQAYLAGIDTMDDYSVNKRKIQAEIDDKAARMASVQSAPINQDEMKKRIRTVRGILASDADYKEKNAAIRGIVEKIVFSRPAETVEIYLFG